MKIHMHVVLAISLLLVSIQGCQGKVITPTAIPAVTSTLSDPHHHNGDMSNNSLGPQNISEFRLTESTLAPGTEQEGVVINQQKTFQAFFACNPDCKIFIEDLKTNQIYQLEAPSFLPTRPFSELAWVTSDILVFDQWMQPHYGVHYAVDIAEGKLILASPFTDQSP